MATYRVARPVSDELIFSDRVTGIDRYPASLIYGKLACPVILLWLTPTVDAPCAQLVGGALAHGAEVGVYGSVEIAGSWYYFCKTLIMTDLGAFPQIGWVKDTLLEKAGRGANYG